MRRAPRHPNAAILDRSRLVLICAQGCLIAALTIGAFVYLLFGLNSGLDQARTVAFTVLVVAHLVNAFNCRSNEESVFLLGLLANKALLLAVCGSILLQIVILSNTHTREIFRAVALTPAHWMLILGLGFLPLAVMEGWKLSRRLP
jgi:Ca2+-transporting ATPase